MADANDPIDWTGKKKVTLDLQGGSSHGAFTWGVLDYLLEDARFDIEAIARMSSGAMSTCVRSCVGSMVGADANLCPSPRNSTPSRSLSSKLHRFGGEATQQWLDETYGIRSV